MAEKLDERFHVLGFDLVKVRLSACHTTQASRPGWCFGRPCHCKLADLAHCHQRSPAAVMLSATGVLPTTTKSWAACVCNLGPQQVHTSQRAAGQQWQPCSVPCERPCTAFWWKGECARRCSRQSGSLRPSRPSHHQHLCRGRQGGPVGPSRTRAPSTEAQVVRAGHGCFPLACSSSAATWSWQPSRSGE